MRLFSLSMIAATFLAVCVIAAFIVLGALGAPSTTQSLATLYHRPLAVSAISPCTEDPELPCTVDVSSSMDQLLRSAAVFTLFLGRL